MEYRSLFDVDFKHTLPSQLRRKRHHFVLPAITIAVITVMSVVVANVNITPNKSAVSEQVATSLVETIPLTLETKSEPASAIKYSAPIPVKSETTSDVNIANLIHPNSEEAVPQSYVETVKIKKGDSLSSLFSKRNLNKELHKIMQMGDQVKELKSIFPGQKIHFHLAGNDLTAFEIETSVNRRIKIGKQDDSYIVNEIVRDFETRLQVASSTIEDSLFLAGKRAGLSAALIMELANVFGWDIDFALDIRSGDQFSVVYEEKYLDGEKIKDGTIIAAEFINIGKKFRAARYTNSNGDTDYYSEDGRSMRKPFLRTPVDFARISSRFNLKRKHPILNKIRAHKGVDYAASTGTPIKASGDGKIVHRGKKGGYGRTVIIRHGGTYSTLYAHMHKYARNTQVGKRVKQGQIIGYIGKSGLATGPHLHYEFRVNGVHRNPLTVKLPDAKPLAKSELARFKSATADQFAQLDLYSSTLLAQNKQ